LPELIRVIQLPWLLLLLLLMLLPYLQQLLLLLLLPCVQVLLLLLLLLMPALGLQLHHHHLPLLLFVNRVCWR